MIDNWDVRAKKAEAKLEALSGRAAATTTL